MPVDRRCIRHTQTVDRHNQHVPMIYKFCQGILPKELLSLVIMMAIKAIKALLFVIRWMIWKNPFIFEMVKGFWALPIFKFLFSFALWYNSNKRRYRESINLSEHEREKKKITNAHFIQWWDFCYAKLCQLFWHNLRKWATAAQKKRQSNSIFADTFRFFSPSPEKKKKKSLLYELLILHFSFHPSFLSNTANFYVIKAIEWWMHFGNFLQRKS